MGTTVQLLMSGFAIAGFILAKLHTILSSPVSRDVMKLIAEAADQQQKVEAHGKLANLAKHGTSLFKDLAAIRHKALDSANHGAQVAGATSADAELEAVLAQAKALYLANKNKN